jgi:HPt (histidine-containing phosphotransfer) domain-containing protein
MSSLDDALAAIWERSRPLIRERLDTVQAAADAAGAGTLDDAKRREGLRAAHQLAGSLGTFGLHEATDLARELEAQFAEATDAARVAALSVRLNEVVAPRLA